MQKKYMQKPLLKGVAGLTERIQDVNYAKYFKKIANGFSFISNHVNNIALLDPEGFGIHKDVRIPVLVSQVIDRNQRCEFLPQKCFKEGKMKVERGQLFVKGKAYPIMPIANAGLERAVTCDNKQLYAINTNHQEEALKSLGLKSSSFINKRLVIACDGNRVLSPPKGNDRRLMRAVYNAKLSPETRRIRNEATGATMWPLTLFVAMPLNLCAGLLNVAFLIPHAACNSVSKLFNAAASNLEQRANSLSVINSRGTVVGAQSAIPYVMLGSVLRCAERVMSALSCVVGSVRSTFTCAVRSIPTFVSAAYNGSGAQFKVGATCITSTASSIGSVFSRYGSDTVQYGKLYSGVFTGSEDMGVTSSRSASRTEMTESQVSDGIAFKNINTVEQANDSSISRNAENLRETKTISLSKDDLLQVRAVGQDLASMGVTVGYGTAQQVQENFASALGIGGGQALAR